MLLKIICDEGPSVLLQNMKKPAKQFLRGYWVATCCFIKNKTSSHVFFSQFAIKLGVPYGETRYSYKIEGSCYLPSTDKYDLRRHYSL